MTDDAVERNKAAVLDLVELSVNTHPRDARKAAEKYIATDYKQHAQGIAQGRDGFIEFHEKLYEEYPEIKMEVEHVVAEGDLVVIHWRAKRGGDDPGWKGFDMIRVEDGVMAEHWMSYEDIVE